MNSSTQDRNHSCQDCESGHSLVLKSFTPVSPSKIGRSWLARKGGLVSIHVFESVGFQFREWLCPANFGSEVPLFVLELSGSGSISLFVGP